MGRRVDVQNARTRARGDYAQALAKIEADGICPFCEAHLPKHHTKPILFRNAEELPIGAWESLGSAYRQLVAEYRIEGATLILRTGKTDFTGASVAHLHAQVISGGRREADSEFIRALVGFKAKP